MLLSTFSHNFFKWVACSNGVDEIHTIWPYNFLFYSAYRCKTCNTNTRFYADSNFYGIFILNL